MASPVAPLSASDDSDNSMQIDSDLDIHRDPDVDAEGEEDANDEEEDIPLPAPPHSNGASGSYHSKRAVRPLPHSCIVCFAHALVVPGQGRG